MRATDYLAMACAFALCISSIKDSTRLHGKNDVQAFSYAEADVLLKATEHGGADYLNSIVFLGDSRTYGLKAFAMLEGGEETTQVWTPKNGTMSIWDMQMQRIVFPITDREITISEAVALTKPKILLISLGFNGVNIVEKEYFVNEYLKLIDAVQKACAETVIILQSMFPVCRSYTTVHNADIREGNAWIVEIAKRANVHYLNTQEVLTDAEGYLKEEYSTDGCHLTPLGLDVELEYICTHMVGET